MKDLAILFVHLLKAVARLLGPGGAKALIAGNLLIKQQFLILTRSRQRALNLTPRDRILLGLWSLLLRPARLHKVAMAPPIAPTRPPRFWSQSADHIGDPLDVRERLGVLEPRPLDPQQQVVDTEDLDVAL